jgi:amidase
MTEENALHLLSASDATRLIAEGNITSEALVTSCLEHIQSREPVVQAWAYLDPDLALAQARACDRTEPLGPLHGVPVGVKDIIETGDMPTEYGSAIYPGHRPQDDAICIARARAAGAVILGKTVSTEFAYLSLAKTCNPHNPDHTPGGSSSGSAAAVGDSMVPLAFGTQTGGSTIRPAAYCGAFGFKPTYNRVALTGIKPLSVSFDTLGMMARSVDDIALLDAALTGATTLEPQMSQSRSPRVGFCQTPFWDETEESTRRALADALAAHDANGVAVDEVALPEEISEVSAGHGLVMSVEAAFAFDREYREHRDGLSEHLRQLVEAGRAVAPNDVQRFHRVQVMCALAVDRLFDDHDVILTPNCPGEAEKGHAVGNNVFNRIWTAMHMPCLTIPSSTGPLGLPVGVQLVGRAGRDRKLLAFARQISEWLLP